MQLDFSGFLLMLLCLISVFFLSRNLFIILFSMENYNIHKKRLKQLRFQQKKSDEEEIKELISNVTKPTIKYILPKLKINNLEDIEYKLKISEWNKYFTPIQYVAFTITFKIIGVVLFLLLFKPAKFVAILWLMALCFAPNFLLNNTINEKKEKIISDFPDFIRIVQGYLKAGMPFSKAVFESIKYVGDAWKPILQQFVIECDTKSIDEALDMLKETVDLFEVREFVALVKLSLEQGGNIRDSFEAQAEKIRELQIANMEMKIGRRQTMAILVQAPLLLCNLLVFGLPTLTSVMNMQSM